MDGSMDGEIMTNFIANMPYVYSLLLTGTGTVGVPKKLSTIVKSIGNPCRESGLLTSKRCEVIVRNQYTGGIKDILLVIRNMEVAKIYCR